MHTLPHLQREISFESGCFFRYLFSSEVSKCTFSLNHICVGIYAKIVTDIANICCHLWNYKISSYSSDRNLLTKLGNHLNKCKDKIQVIN